MNTYGGDLRRLVAIFHSPKRTFTEIGDTPGVAVVIVATFLFLAVPSLFGDGRAEVPAVTALLAIGWPLVASALYLFVFDLFGAEARYRVILSVTLHAMWAVLLLTALLALVQLVAGGPALEIRGYLMSSAGVDERLARDLARMLNPLEIGRLLLTGLGFAIALRIARWMSFAVVFAGWFGFHSLPLLRFLLF